MNRANDRMTIAEKTALAIVRAGRSFAEAAESSNVPVTRIMDMWKDAAVQPVGIAKGPGEEAP